MKIKYFDILLFVSIILVLYVCYYLYSHKNTIENATFSQYNTITPDKFNEIFNNVSLDKFNEIFKGDIVALPKNVIAIGISENKYYSYNADTDNSDFFNLFIPFIHYWYNQIHPQLNMNNYYFIFCFYDGYRERLPYCNTLVPFVPDKQYFLNKLEISDIDKCSQPILHKHKYIFVNSKVINDDTAICIPDHHYINDNGYENTIFKKVDENDIAFDEKQSVCVYRGNIKNGSVYNFKKYENKNDMNQRSYLKKIKDRINNFDYSDDFKSIEEQLKFKYILDVDGYSNTWDATVWKLYSGSVLLKTESIWKQWYYDDLIEWVHYVPIKNDFSDLNDKIKWCIDNDEKCKEIIKNSRKFVIEKLNWNKTKNDTIDIFKKYTKESFTL